MDNKKIVVAAANGFIGANLCRHFSMQGHEVYAILRKDSNLWRLNGIEENLQCIFISEFNSSSLSEICKKIKPEVVLNATVAEQKEFLTNPDGNWNSNFMPSVKFVNHLRGLSVEKFVSAGSSFKCGKVCSSNNLLSEGLKCRPVSEYAIPKLMQSEYLKLVSSLYSLDIIVLRNFYVSVA